jgi:hypothetical protein
VEAAAVVENHPHRIPYLMRNVDFAEDLGVLWQIL